MVFYYIILHPLFKRLIQPFSYGLSFPVAGMTIPTQDQISGTSSFSSYFWIYANFRFFCICAMLKSHSSQGTRSQYNTSKTFIVFSIVVIIILYVYVYCQQGHKITLLLLESVAVAPRTIDGARPAGWVTVAVKSLNFHLNVCLGFALLVFVILVSGVRNLINQTPPCLWRLVKFSYVINYYHFRW